MQLRSRWAAATVMTCSAPAWLLVLGLQAATLSGQGFDFAAAVGVATVDEEGELCVAIQNPSIAPTTPLVLLDVVGGGPAVPAQVLARREERCPRDLIASGETLYRAALTGGHRTSGVLYVAVLASAERLQELDGEFQLDIDGQGELETFRVCASSEGLHLTVWSGPALTGERRWHRYFYLGYDVEPDCTEREVAPS